VKILVCVKQVPDTGARFRPNPAGTWYAEADLAFRMNEYDEHAVEEAIRLKERLGGAPEVTVLSVGPARVLEALRKALAMGCDRAVHVEDPAAADRDPWQVASIIAAWARGRGFDLVLTGMQSADRGSAQVGVLVAERLGLAAATTAVAFECDGQVATVRRELEGGTRGVVRLPLPALVTCQLGLNVPRYPTLPNIMKARKKPLEAVPVAGLLDEAPRAETLRFYEPPRRQGGRVLEGPLDRLVEELTAILRERALPARSHP
jgi:electron transfer flavoprotein beta subunit